MCGGKGSRPDLCRERTEEIGWLQKDGIGQGSVERDGRRVEREGISQIGSSVGERRERSDFSSDFIVFLLGVGRESRWFLEISSLMTPIGIESRSLVKVFVIGLMCLFILLYRSLSCFLKSSTSIFGILLLRSRAVSEILLVIISSSFGT